MRNESEARNKDMNHQPPQAPTVVTAAALSRWTDPELIARRRFPTSSWLGMSAMLDDRLSGGSATVRSPCSHRYSLPKTSVRALPLLPSGLTTLLQPTFSMGYASDLSRNASPCWVKPRNTRYKNYFSNPELLVRFGNLVTSRKGLLLPH